MNDDIRLLEAILFQAGNPVTITELTKRCPHIKDIEIKLNILQKDYESRGIHLYKHGQSWVFTTALDLSPALEFLQPQKRQLSRAAMETLAIIAYHQPVTRGDIEQIRGHAVAQGTIKILLENQWIKSLGRKESIGRPTLWGTSDIFLAHFGLDTINSLPNYNDVATSGYLSESPVFPFGHDGDNIDDQEQEKLL